MVTNQLRDSEFQRQKKRDVLLGRLPCTTQTQVAKQTHLSVHGDLPGGPTSTPCKQNSKVVCLQWGPDQLPPLPLVSHVEGEKVLFGRSHFSPQPQHSHHKSLTPIQIPSYFQAREDIYERFCLLPQVCRERELGPPDALSIKPIPQRVRC